MKIARVQWRDEVSYAVIENQRVRSLVKHPYEDVSYSGREMQLSDVTLLAPCQPTKVIGVAGNYGPAKDAPKEPLIFIKPPSSVIGLGEPIFHPAESRQVSFNAALAVVIGRRCRFVSKEEAHKYVFGYTCCNDVTATDLQASDAQWTRSKSYDTFCPLGPWIETELDWRAREVKGMLDGSVKQQDSTDNLIFGVDELVSAISQIMTLEPGDVIITGTPAGEGTVQRGGHVSIEVSGIGALENSLV